MKTRGATRSLTVLSELLFRPCAGGDTEADHGLEMDTHFSESDFADLLVLASSNHVIVRAFGRFRKHMATSGKAWVARWADNAIQSEQARINHALPFLESICAALQEGGCEAVVIKSLDHWPDLGSDLDLYTNGDAASVVEIMKSRLQARLEPRSWGDRLANKWNFVVPGLPELVEVHVGRLGQTGEQIAIAGSLVDRSQEIQIAAHRFQVPSPEDRLLISTLQRMYRHFYIRLCDVADTAQLLESGSVNYARLRSSASSGGLWDGLATYLRIVSDYVKSYRRTGTPLPSPVSAASRFGGDQVTFSKGFLRIPILPHSAGLYASELKRLLLNGELRNSVRLSLLPCLATAAALEFKITGSDKGIW